MGVGDKVVMVHAEQLQEGIVSAVHDDGTCDVTTATIRVKYCPKFTPGTFHNPQDDRPGSDEVRGGATPGGPVEAPDVKQDEPAK